ncbi:MAG: HAD family hydrolase [Bacteroidales bacterium]
MYKHIIFDIDGTLLDTEKTGVLSLQKTVKEMLNKDMSYDEIYPYFGIPSLKAVKMLGFPDLEAAAYRWEENFQSMMQYVTPFDGVEAMLKQLKENDKQLGIVTSRSEFEFSYDPHLKIWKQWFDYIVCSEDSPRHKPYPDPMLAYIDKSGAVPSECLYFGDTIYDFHCGNDAGVDFVLADWRNRGMQGVPAKYRCSNVKEMLQVIFK